MPPLDFVHYLSAVPKRVAVLDVRGVTEEVLTNILGPDESEFYTGFVRPEDGGEEAEGITHHARYIAAQLLATSCCHRRIHRHHVHGCGYGFGYGCVVWLSIETIAARPEE